MISVYINVIDLHQEIETVSPAWREQLLAKENFSFRKLKFTFRVFFVLLKLRCWCSFVPPASPVVLGRAALPKLPRLCPSALMPAVLLAAQPAGSDGPGHWVLTGHTKPRLSSGAFSVATASSCAVPSLPLQAACLRWAQAPWLQRADRHILRIFVIGTRQAARRNYAALCGT